MKKIVSTLLIMIIATFTMAQTATLTIGNVTANPGETVSIPVTVSSSTPLLAAEFNMAFNTAVLNEASITYTNFHPNFPEYEWFYNATNGLMLLNWVSGTLTPVPVQGTITLFEIQCEFVGGYTDIEWTLDLLIDGSSEIIPVNSINGSVAELVVPEITVELPHLSASPGATVLIPVTITGASAQGVPILAAELNIDFDPAVIDYSTIVFKNFNALMPEYEWIYNATSGKMLLNWVSSNLSAIAIPDGSVMFDIECQFLGGQTDLEWSLALLVDGDGNEVSTITISGSISSESPAVTVFNGIGNWSNPAFWDNGVPGLSSVATIESGLATIDSEAFAYDLTVNAGAALTIETTGTLNIDGDLMLASNNDNTPSGSLINNGTLEIVGQSTMQRWLSGGQNHFISTPVSVTTLGMLYNPANPGYFYEYSEPSKSWLNLFQLNTPLLSSKGYALNFLADELVDVTGNFNNLPSYNPVISYTEDKGGDDGWNLVGNPYTSALDWEAESWQKTNLEGGIYFYDGTNYQTYNGGYGVPATASQYIPAMQGFFVKAMGSGAELVVPKAAQVHSSQEYFKGTRETVNALRLKISGNNYSDEALIRFDPSATNAFDAQMDAYKLFSFNTMVPQVFTLAATLQTINALPSQGSSTWSEKMVVLGYSAGASGQYIIEASEMESFTAGQVNTIELYDSETQVYIDLIENPVYTFNANEGMNTSRFRVYFNRVVTGIGEVDMNDVVIYSIERTIFIENASGVAIVYNLAGQEVARAELVQDEINSISLNKGGMYMVKVVNGSSNLASEKVFLY
ncbi:MAG TPA: cohesin domain-containing protein [Bacteroidales bacterium]|nr:cohesin domain-containing protein [Bacteroidales bacterium]